MNNTIRRLRTRGAMLLAVAAFVVALGALATYLIDRSDVRAQVVVPGPSTVRTVSPATLDPLTIHDPFQGIN